MPHAYFHKTRTDLIKNANAALEHSPQRTTHLESDLGIKVG